MFNKQFIIMGSHAEKVQQLKDIKFIDRIFDILIVGPLYGVSYGRRSKPTRSSSKSTTIFSDIIQQNIDKLMIVYYTTLSYHFSSLPIEKRINRIFLSKSSKDDMLLENYEVFIEYLLGGIEKIFEDLNKIITDQNKDINNSFDAGFITDCMNTMAQNFKKNIIDSDFDLGSINKPVFR